MDRRITTPKLVISTTWGPPPPCKRVLKYLSLTVHNPLSFGFCSQIVTEKINALFLLVSMFKIWQECSIERCARLCMVRSKKEGYLGVYGIAVLGFFSCGISVILILTCGIAVSSSSAVCGFLSFWLTVLRYRLFALSFRYNMQNKTQ